MKTKQSELIYKLETLVDESSLYDVVIALSLMCEEKREHIISTYQDRATARPWAKSAKELEKAARVISNLGI